MINTVIFDLDGTLTTSIEIIIKGYEHTIKTYFSDVILTEADKISFPGNTLVENFNKYTKDKSLQNEMEKTYRTYTNKMSETSLKTYPKAREVINNLKDSGVKVAIVTSKSYEVALKDLEIVGLNGMFDVVIGYEHTKKHKPEPDSILKALKMLKSNYDEAIYIGDHPNDIKAAHNAKMQSCAVTYSFHLKEMLLENPTYVIDELENINDIVL